MQDLHSNCVLVYAFMHLRVVFQTDLRDIIGKQAERFKNMYVSTDLTCFIN